MREVARDNRRLWVFLKAPAAVRLIASVPPRWAELLDVKRLGRVDLQWGCKYARAELDKAAVKVLEVDGCLRNPESVDVFAKWPR